MSRCCHQIAEGEHHVTVTTDSDVYYDPYDAEIDADPYPV